MPTAMQLGHTRLTPEEHQRLGLCYYCGQGGHHLNCCLDQLRSSNPVSSREMLVSQDQEFRSSPHVQLPGTLSFLQSSVSLPLLVDLGADDNFIDSDFVSLHGIPIRSLQEPRAI